MGDALRNVKQAAEWLGIPPKTLYAMTAARTVPFTKVGRHIRFSDDHLREIVAAGEQTVIKPPSLRLAGTHPPAGPSTPSPPSGPKPATLRRAG